MTGNLGPSDWLTARGDKWLARLPAMEAMLAPVDDPLIAALRLDAPYRIADVGCGGGGTSLELRCRAPTGTVVHGYDISPALIEVARARAGERGEVAFEVADVGEVVPPTPYDRLISRFGTMFFSAPEPAFANLARWLVPRGRFAFAVWGPARDNPWMTATRDAVAEVVSIPASDPEGPGPFRYASPATLLALLTRAGLGALEVAEWRGSLPLGGGLAAAEAAKLALGSFSTFGELLLAAGDDAARQAHRTLTAALAEHEVGGSVRMAARVHIVTGIRPG